MFGFPGDFEKHFISAWQEPFTGFELKWIEVEICRQAMVPTNVTDLFDRMKESYPDLQDMHQSKFYRIISTLVSDGYLEDKQEGRAKIIKTQPQGAKELGRITRYFFELQMERFKFALWQDLIGKITKYTGCLLEQKVVVFGPEYNTVNTLIRECLKCDYRDAKKNTEENNYHSNFIFLNHKAILNGKVEDSTIFDVDQVDDWLPKAGSIDTVVLFNPLTSFSEHATDILNEAKRVIGADGKIVLFEITQEDSSIISTFMREAAYLLNYSNPSTSWYLPEIPFKNQIIEEWINKSNVTIVKKFPDIISSIFILE